MVVQIILVAHLDILHRQTDRPGVFEHRQLLLVSGGEHVYQKDGSRARAVVHHFNVFQLVGKRSGRRRGDHVHLFSDLVVIARTPVPEIADSSSRIAEIARIEFRNPADELRLVPSRTFDGLGVVPEDIFRNRLALLRKRQAHGIGIGFAPAAFPGVVVFARRAAGQKSQQ